MPRPNRPWRRKDRDNAWYAKIEGKKVRLAEPDDSEATAEKALRRLLVASEAVGDVSTGPTVAELVTAFLVDLAGLVARREKSPETARSYANNLRHVPETLGAVLARDLRPHHVKAFLDDWPSWNSTTRSNVVTAVKRVFRWAKADGRIEVNPIADLTRPSPRRREAIPTTEQAALAIEACVSPEFALFLQVLHETGCRPAEARTVEAGDLDFQRGLWHRKGKTTHATGKERVVFLTAELVEVLQALSVRFPTGPLLRNTEGNPWKPNAINCQMRRLRDRINRREAETAAREGREPRKVAGKELVPYGLRHRFITDGVLAGVDLTTLVNLAGHTGPKMIVERYAHLLQEHEHMRGALAKVRGKVKS